MIKYLSSFYYFASFIGNFYIISCSICGKLHISSIKLSCWVVGTPLLVKQFTTLPFRCYNSFEKIVLKLAFIRSLGSNVKGNIQLFIENWILYLSCLVADLYLQMAGLANVKTIRLNSPNNRDFFDINRFITINYMSLFLTPVRCVIYRPPARTRNNLQKNDRKILSCLEFLLKMWGRRRIVGFVTVGICSYY